MVKDIVSSVHGDVVADKVQEASVGISMASRKKQFKGVRMRSWGSWVSEIRAPNQKTRIWLGSYSTPEAAARAYDAAVLCLKGSSANLNFPVNPSIHIPSTLMSPKSIKRVAAAAANATNLSPSSSPPPPPPPTTTTTTTTTTSCSSSSTTSSSSPSTPSISYPSPSPPPSSPSSTLDYQDQHFASCGANHTSCLVEELSQFIDPWFGFGDSLSPKCIDQMLDACSIYEPPPALEECDEEDIRLWNFC